jgi:hypothetical protein
MILCDLCGQSKECWPREIEGREYDICSKCWNRLAQKLEGKGRVKRDREMVFLPPRTTPTPPEPAESKPLPGEPPRIWSSSTLH